MGGGQGLRPADDRRPGRPPPPVGWRARRLRRPPRAPDVRHRLRCTRRRQGQALGGEHPGARPLARGRRHGDGPLPAATAGWIALGVAAALAALHETGPHAPAPSHRRTCCLTGSGPVLTDFGTSRAALISGPGTAADDVLMLGATAFFAATGRSPWGGRPAPLAPARRVTVSVPPGDSDLDGCPPWLAPIVLACLAAEPAERPAAERLHAWLLGEVGHQPRSWLPAPGRRPGRRMPGAAVTSRAPALAARPRAVNRLADLGRQPGPSARPGDRGRRPGPRQPEPVFGAAPS